MRIRKDSSFQSLAPLGVIVVSVIMFFAAIAIDIFWLAKLTGKAFPSTMPVDTSVYNAFALPDVILSILLYAGAYGIFKLRRYGLVISLVAMGMWIFDSLLVLGITKLERISIVGPCLFFAISTIVFLWIRKDLFDGVRT